MTLINAPTSGPKQYWLSDTNDSFTEEQIVQQILAGKHGPGRQCSETKPRTFGTEYKPLNSYPVFARAFDAQIEQRKDASRRAEKEAKKNAILNNSDPAAPLAVRDNGTSVGEYTAAQVRHLFLTARITARAEFKHPNLDDWVPCMSLVKETLAATSAVSGETMLREELRAIQSQCAKTKWAVRGVALLLISLVYFGFKIVVRIYG